MRWPITEPAISRFKPEPAISPTRVPPTGACWLRKAILEQQVRPGAQARRVPPDRRVRQEPRVPRARLARPDLKGRPELAARRIRIHRTEAINTRFKN